MSRGARPPDLNPENSIFGRDRRHATRHLAYTPAYANLSGSAQGAVLELCEIINISEEGVCIQASSPMKTNRLLPLCVELSETGGRIHVVGHVVWSDALGRTGIRFPEMSESGRGQLNEWLQVNIRAETAHAEAADAHRIEADRPTVQTKSGSASSYTSQVSEWAEIQKEVELCGPDLDPALHLIVQRALTMTWASGTAIALINKLRSSEMMCRARAGTDSPELGARLESGSGFSGECVRTGQAIVCDDSEYDSRVDRHSCRALGIRSILACPIKRDQQVIGIIEVFSPEPAAFWENDIRILRRLAELVTGAVRRAEYARADVLAFPIGGQLEPEPSPTSHPSDQPSTFAKPKPNPPRRQALLLVAGFASLIALGWLVAPWVAKLGSSSSDFTSLPSARADTSPDNFTTMRLQDVRKLATSGNIGAEYSLAMRYANGDGTKQDYSQARQWFLRAAEGGHIRAQSKAAACFWAGKGGPQDYSKAYFWALLAQAGGDETSPAIVMNSAAHLSPAQTSAEQKEAEQWLHSHHIGHSSESVQ